MGYLERQRAWQEEEERRREQWRKFQRHCDEIYEERVLHAGSFYPWAILIVVLLLIASFLYSAYSTSRRLQNHRPAVQPPAATPAQGQPPPDTKPKRRADRQAATPATERN